MIFLDSKGSVGPRILYALKNGAVAVYNLKRQTAEFQTETGHFETIFGVQYSSADKDLLASCSYDGTVRIWDSMSMKLLQVNDTNFNSAQSKLEKKIIYSLSWHPSDRKLAITTVNGNLMVYEALKNKQLSHITPVPGEASFCCHWNQSEPRLILMSTAANQAFVIEAKDFPACKNLEIVKTYPHPNKTYGCQWNPTKSTEFITACEDGLLRIFDFA